MGCPSTSPKRYEAETNCVKEHDLGQVASEGVYNVGYYSKTGAYAARFFTVPITCFYGIITTTVGSRN